MTRPASVGDGDRVRLFCALTFPDRVLDRLAAWQHGLPRGDFRPVPRENLHATLAFLGTHPREELERVCAELRAASAAAGPIVLAARRYRETQSVGMLVFADEGAAAGRLAADLHARLQRLGVYEPERRPWLAHVTVVRFRRPPRLDPALPELGAVSPSGAAVYHSLLRPGGAQHEVLEFVRLGG